MTDIHAHRILILDFGSQYTQPIARRVREAGVYCELHPYDMNDAALRAFKISIDFLSLVLSANGITALHARSAIRRLSQKHYGFDVGV